MMIIRIPKMKMRMDSVVNAVVTILSHAYASHILQFYGLQYIAQHDVCSLLQDTSIIHV